MGKLEKLFMNKLLVMSSLLIPAIVLLGCATASVMNKLSLGMTKPQVLEVMGTPVSTRANENVEYLNYRLKETSAGYDIKWPYFVRIRDGKVDAYGRLGDFNSTRNSAVDINLNK